MELETNRLILRKLTMDDFNDLYKILSDKETMKHYPKPFDEDKVKSLIQWNLENYKTFGFGLFAVVLKDNNQMIGDCGITIKKIHGKIKPEIEYHINKDFQKQGYAIEAAMKCRDYIFENTTFNSIYSCMKYTNISSFTVALKNGMKLVDDFEDPQNLFTKVYSITREQWKGLKIN